jgi:hypothetical protein
MADNVAITPGSGATAAADDIDGALHQRVKITVGSDGVSRGDVDVTNPMPVRQDDLGSIEQAAEQLKTSLINTGNDEPLQLVGLHPNFPLPIDTATPMPIAGVGPIGEQRQVAVDGQGALLPSNETVRLAFARSFPTSTPGTLAVIDCTGFQSLIAIQRSGFSGTPIVFAWSMDNVNFFTATGIDYNPTSGPNYIYANNILSTTGMYAFPVLARYLRISTASVSSTTTVSWEIYLKRNPLTVGTVPPITAITLSQIAGVSAVTAANGVLGIGGPAAPGSAHSTTSPVQISGSDGTLVRRILTDTAGNTAVVGHVTTGATLIPATSNRGPVLVGAADLEQRAQRMVVDGLGRLRIQIEESGTKDDGVIDALNNVVRELKLLNAKLTDLPYYLGINSVMPDDDKAFRDDRTLFNQ